jgi:hypothetical protein
MTEAQVFELLGRKQAALELIQGDYSKLVGVVLQIKMGKVSLDRLTVNPDGTWLLSPEIVKQEDMESVSA